MSENLTRRDYLRQLSAASLATLSTGAPRLLGAAEGHAVVQPKATADACILLWMGGGMAAPETESAPRGREQSIGRFRDGMSRRGLSLLVRRAPT